MSRKTILLLMLAFLTGVLPVYSQNRKQKAVKENQPTLSANTQIKNELNALKAKHAAVQNKIKPLREEFAKLSGLITVKQATKQPVAAELTRQKQLQNQLNPLDKEELKLSVQIRVKQAQINLTEIKAKNDQSRPVKSK